ncbi:MAG TPA: YchJ family metal-binding protein [Polyangia bacterium]|jgi:SEC-C motif-containing protein|nr:YchJ family metal-binding protein [Polyangia bacterium]
MPPVTPRDCPCRSQLRYAACCRPFHRGDASPPTPEALMRSRFSAFALGLGDYLVDTLATTHPDRAAPREALARELSRVRVTQRFTGLWVLQATTGEGEHGQVLFHARVFEDGRGRSRSLDRSFVELSDFVCEAGAWRYASGVLLPAQAFGDDVSSLTSESFLARVAAANGGE